MSSAGQDPDPDPSPDAGVAQGTATTTIATQNDVVAFNRGFELSGAIDVDGGSVPDPPQIEIG
jgi:hypothetical protein